MFKLHRRIEYALLALKYMNRKFPGQLTSAKEICDHFHIPFDPTSRVLQLMNQQGIVQAEQGAHGGYQIIRDLAKVSLQELNDLLVGPIQITECLRTEGTPCEAQQNCEITGAVKLLNNRVREIFVSLSVAEMLSQLPLPRKKSAPAATPA